MRPLAEAAPDAFAGVRFVLTDMDETLTFDGRLGARTYDALERLRAAGVKVVPVTAAPAGWCDQMARMWPVDGVVGENGGFCFTRAGGGELDRLYWTADEGVRAMERTALTRIGEAVRAARPDAVFADDQPFRLTTLAYRRPADPAARSALVEALRRAGADATVNNLWVLGWLGGYDKLKMARTAMAARFDLDIDRDGDAALYVGDSVNDAPMFGFFRHTVGVSTVAEHLDDIPRPPAWVTRDPGGAGFVEAAEAILRTR